MLRLLEHILRVALTSIAKIRAVPCNTVAANSQGVAGLTEQRSSCRMHIGLRRVRATTKQSCISSSIFFFVLWFHVKMIAFLKKQLK